jgi:hypothetical protein
MGCVFFTVTPTATLVLSDNSNRNKQVCLNSSMHILGGFVYVVGSLVYISCHFNTHQQQYLIAGATLFVIASMIYVFANIWDIYRTRKQNNDQPQMARVFVFNLTGSVLFLVASFLSLPSLYTPHTNGIFLAGSLCFSADTLSSRLVQLRRRYAPHPHVVTPKQQIILKHKLPVDDIKTPSDAEQQPQCNNADHCLGEGERETASRLDAIQTKNAPRYISTNQQRIYICNYTT